MSYQIRLSQVIQTWPTGSIIDLPGLSLIMICHDDNNSDWGIENYHDEKQRKHILYDSRLAAAFHVKQFAIPPIFDGRSTLSIYSLRFPRAQYCPKCGRISFSDKEKSESLYPGQAASYNRLMKPYHCENSGCYLANNLKETPKLIPMRFVIATEEGFLDDFPWDWFVHNSCPDQRRKGNILYYNQKGGSAGLQDMEIISKDNHGKFIASRNLGDIFDQKIFTELCPTHGHYLNYVDYKLPKPWLGWTLSNNKFDFTMLKVFGINPNTILQANDDLTPIAKRKFPRTIQRGAGNIFFPIIYSGIRLPEECYNLTCPDEIQNCFLNTIENLINDSPENYNSYDNSDWKEYFINKININANYKLLKFGYLKNELERFIKNYFGDGAKNRTHIIQFELREQEFKAFKGDFHESDKIWFKKKDLPAINYKDLFHDNFVEQIILLEKLSVLKVFKGFTRIKPLMSDELIFANESDNFKDSYLKEDFQRIQDARKDPINTKELPAIEIKGEGIFIQFNNNVLNEWAQKYPDYRINVINSNLQKANLAFNQNQSLINKRYLLLHTLSHIILKELADDCGYGLTSLAEIIYCSSDDSIKTDNEMNGILVFTTTSDAEGSLGGLVEKGEPNYLSKLISKAVEKSRWCSSDPLCISAENGQGFLGLNLAACYSCVLLPETCCEKMNKYLDRATLVGTISNPNIGFFNK